TSKVEKEFYLRCSYLTLSVLFDKEPRNVDRQQGAKKYEYISFVVKSDWFAYHFLRKYQNHVNYYQLLIKTTTLSVKNC
ncbi:hypothetical protein LC948_14490, partial [Enterococcus faecium]